MSGNDYVKPWGLRWRSSFWFVTFAVGLGIMCDLLVYSLIIPVIPYQLQSLGYSGVPGLVGWLLFAFSGGLVLSTPPIASLSEKYKNRKIPLILGLVALIGSQVMLMEAPTYWLMCLARVLQGVSSSVVWTVGLALLCDCTPERLIGRQLGFAVTGLSVGVLVGPPAAGALYERWGFRAPFIFGIIITFVDLLARLLIIERKDAIKWGVDPAAYTSHSDDNSPPADSEAAAVTTEVQHTQSEKPESSPPSVTPAVTSYTPLGLLWRLLRSSRAMICILNTLVYGVIFTGQEAVLTLHLQAIWGLNPSQAGLAFIAAIVPTFVAMPLAGWRSDTHGPEWVTVCSLLFSIPWWVVLIIDDSLAQFLVFFGIQSFFTSGVMSPLTAELAAVCRSIDGVGFAHVYGAFNLAYGIGNAIGPIISGQIYDHSSQGWKIFCLISTGLIACSLLLAFFFTGEKPVAKRLTSRLHMVASN